MGKKFTIEEKKAIEAARIRKIKTGRSGLKKKSWIVRMYNKVFGEKN